jgi:erythromycin esterase
MKKLAALALFALPLFPSLSAAAAPRPFFDLDLEAPECSSGWWEFGEGPYDISVDGSESRSGRQSLVMRYTGGSPWAATRQWAGTAEQDIPGTLVAGKKLHFSVEIKTEEVEEVTAGEADLWAVAFGPEDTVLSAAGTEGRGAAGTAPWTRYEIDLAVPAGTTMVAFGGQLAGNGTAWFDKFGLEINGRPWRETLPKLSPPSPQAVSWLRSRAIPVATVEAENGFADLQPLEKLIGDARVVSLGEQTHGTREFFQMKHRVIEFLASEMGFTIFAIEANMPESYRVNDYILAGKGDPKELLKGMHFWTWNTQEVLDMIEWMRRFNESGQGRILFTGFDMQFSSVASGIVREFLGKADPQFAPEAGRLLDRVDAASQRFSGTDEDVAAARQVFAHLESGREAYLARFARDEVEWAIQNSRITVQNMEALTGVTGRDVSMAKNVEWILDQAPPDAKIVLWAHNGHVSRSPGAMGSYLAQRFGKQMVVLGFAFDQGSYNAIGGDRELRDWEALPPAVNAVESYLKSAGIPRFILDLRQVPAGAPASWLAQPRPFRSIGALAARCSSVPTVVKELFDGLIWTDRTHPSSLLPFR